MIKWIGICLLSSPFLYAQKLSQTELLTSLSDEICNTYYKSGSETVNNTKLGIYLLQAISQHRDDVSFYYGKDYLVNESTMMEIGEQLGVYLAIKCPEIFSSYSDSGYPSLEVEELKVEGKITKVVKEQFLNIQVTESNGRKSTYVLLYPFENAFLLTDGLLNEKHTVELSFYKEELYDAKLGRYVSFNILTDIIKK